MSEVHAAQGAEVAQVQVRDPLISFRFGVPTLPAGHVVRPRLLELMQRGGMQPLTLVSAPAGSGKTSLVADWAAGRDPALTAWITFEEGDGHLSAFWSSVFVQLHGHGVATAAATIAPNATDVPRPVLAEIASTLSDREEPLAVVLDGWEFTTDDVAEGFDFLLRHSKGKLRAVIVTRSDPVLPLHRYRLGGLVTEVRLADLAFSHDEVRELVVASGLTLADQSIEPLVTRTRGWAAGLRFATMWLRHQPDPDAAVLELAGDTGNIAEYLMAEVLEVQSDADRELLLNTCVVEILRPGLIEELGGRTAARGLAQLAHGNAMVETVADHPGWFRYHPFFRELLRAELNYLAPARAIALHRRAARWLADNGALGAAVWHAVAAYQWPEAAQYVVDDLAVAAVFQGCEQEGLSSTLRSMPDSAPGAAAAVVRAALAVSRGDTDTARTQLELARRADDTADVHGSSAGHPQRLANGLVASLLSLTDADAARALDTATAAERELEGQSPTLLAAHPELVAMLSACRATALIRLGRLPESRTALAGAVEVAEAPGCESTLVYCLSHQALLDALDGALRRASDRAERALGLVTSAGVDGRGLQASSLVALCWVALQQGDAASTRQRIADVPVHGGLEVVLRSSLLALASARLVRLEGDPGRATQMVRQLRADAATSAPWVAGLAGDEEVGCVISAGDALPAPELVRSLDDRDDTGAKLSATRFRLRERAAGAADPVGPIAACASEPLVAQVTAGLLVAEAQLQAGDPERARATVQRASRLAAPERLRWPFLDAAPEVRRLMARQQPPTHDGVPAPRANGNGKTQAQAIPRPRGRAGAGQGDDVPPPLIDPLTAKELEVLNHLSQLLTTEEIAAAMFVSVNTVRTHVRSILRKLSVSRRHQAVRRARVLDIISS